MKKATLIACAILFSISSIYSQSNDCVTSGAGELTVGTSCSPVTFNSSNNTKYWNSASGCSGSNNDDAWGWFTATSSSTTITFTPDNTGHDAILHLFTGSCSTGMSALTCSNSGGNGASETITYATTPGQVYMVRVQRNGSNQTMNGTICVYSSAPVSICNNLTVSTTNFSQTGLTTCGAGDDFSSSDVCEDSYMNGDDFVIEYTPTTTGCVSISLTNTDTYTGIFATDECPSSPTATCLGSVTNSAGNPTLASLSITAGQTYYLTVSTWPSPQCTPFDITISTITCPIVPTNVTCGAMDPICSGSPIAFTAAADGSEAEPGNNYDCLDSQPNPSWYYLEISQAGDLVIDITAADDVDYAIWGPFTDLANAQANCGSYTTPVDCSFSISETEQAFVSGVSVGEVYVLLVTNYADVVQTIFVNEAASNSAATDCSIVPLPVELVNFEVSKLENHNLLSWRTKTELNNDYFIVQRSLDGELWETIGFVDGNGTSNTEHIYYFEDRIIESGISYYRFKQVDFDGAFQFSPIRSINRSKENNSTDLYPVPSHGGFTIASSGKTIKDVLISDIAGRKILVQIIQKTDTFFKAELAKNAEGIYNVIIIYEDGSEEVRKLIVE